MSALQPYRLIPDVTGINNSEGRHPVGGYLKIKGHSGVFVFAVGLSWCYFQSSVACFFFFFVSHHRVRAFLHMSGKPDSGVHTV